MDCLAHVKEYVKSFGCSSFLDASRLHLQGSSLYLISDALQQLIADTDEPVSTPGALVASCSSKGVVPSLMLLEFISSNGGASVTVSSKGAWLFVCGRDVFSENITSKSVSLKSPCIVKDQQGGVLGTGVLLSKQGSLMLKHHFDIGVYLRREQ